MIINITHDHVDYFIDTQKPIDISLPVTANSARAWFVDPVKINPIAIGSFIGSIEKGSSVNFDEITIAPHGHGTHTECLGHITKEKHTITQCLKEFNFIARLISLEPENDMNDFFITKELIAEQIDEHPFSFEALIIRTLPNKLEKLSKNYTRTNPPYIKPDAISYLNDIGVQHLLIDLPSVDKENDQGRLESHKIFWQIDTNKQIHKTITEMIFVPDEVADGLYFIQIHIISLESDASPSKPLLYELRSK